MKLAICTDVYGNLSFTDMLDKVKSLGIDAVEMTAGGWAGCPHVKRQELLDSESARIAFMAELEKRGNGIDHALLARTSGVITGWNAACVAADLKELPEAWARFAEVRPFWK